MEDWGRYCSGGWEAYEFGSGEGVGRGGTGGAEELWLLLYCEDDAAADEYGFSSAEAVEGRYGSVDEKTGAREELPDGTDGIAGLDRTFLPLPASIGVLFARDGARMTLSKSLASPRLVPPTRPGTGSFAGGRGTGIGGDGERGAGAATATGTEGAGAEGGARYFLYWYLFRMYFSISLPRSDSSESVGGGWRISSGL